MPITTGELLTESLPELARAGADTVVAAYREFRLQLGEVVGLGESPSRFSWSDAYDIMDDTNSEAGRVGRRLAVAHAAAHTVVRHEGKIISVHSPDSGVFVTADEYGRVIAGDCKPHAGLAELYGPADGYALEKVAKAIVIERLCRQGADWGEGYERLAALEQELRGDALGTGAIRPHIGMATLHEKVYGTVPVGTDRHALMYTGSTHRIATPAFRSLVESIGYINVERPAIDNDFLAGLVDTLSSTVANRVAMHGAMEDGIIVELPDPVDSDYAHVDWN